LADIINYGKLQQADVQLVQTRFFETAVPYKYFNHNFTHVYTCLLPLIRSKYEQKSRGIAGRTARCRCKFRYVSNFTTASYVRFPCRSAAFLLVLVCRLQNVKKW